jgi:SAM-dependent methyltransferase
MAKRKDSYVSGRDHYCDVFRAELDKEAQWLRYGAIEKANSVQMLLERSAFRPRSILELGCGTGAVILECQRRQLASEYCAVDYSREAIDYLRAVSRGIRCRVVDITSPSFRADGDYDLILISHVLEHLEDPHTFLLSVLKRIPALKLIIEVPLDDLLASRCKARFRNRANNEAGHVQFFTPQSFRKLLHSVGLTIERERQYVPSWSEDMLDLITEKDSLSPAQRLMKRATGQYLPRLLRPVWKRWYYSHLAVICSRAAALSLAVERCV